MHTFVRVALLLGLNTPWLAQAASWELKREPGSWSETVTASYKDERGSGVIAICKNDALDVFVDTPAAGAGMMPVTYRVDSGVPATGRWLRMGSLRPTPKLDFLRALLNGRKLTLDVTDFTKKTHRVEMSLDGAREAVGAALKACHFEFEGLETRIPGLRPAIARDLETWGPPYIKAAKKVLRAAGAYDGPLDTPIDAEFALAAQAHHDRYVAGCKAGTIEGDYHCESYREAFLEKEEAFDPGLGSIIYDSAEGELKEEIGSLVPTRR